MKEYFPYFHYKNYSLHSLENENQILNIKTQYEIDDITDNKKNCSKYYLPSINIYAYFYAIPIIYFITCNLTLFILIIKYIFDEKIYEKWINKNYIFPLPSFYEINSIQPTIYFIGIRLISISGLMNVLFYTRMLLQKCSVPELGENKIFIDIMFKFGIISNIIFILFGYSQEFFFLETIDIKEIKISVKAFIYLAFVILNILVGTLGLKILKNLRTNIKCEDIFYNRKLKVKIILLFLSILVLFIYIIAGYIKQQEYFKKIFIGNKESYLIYLQFISSSFPYILFILNSFINLGFYSDIIYIQEKLTIIIDKEYFCSNEESNLLMNYK